MNANFYSIIRERLLCSLDRPSIETASGEVYPYSELDQESARYARFFSDLGIAAGERVIVQVDKSVQGLFLYLGCLRAGLIYLPLNTAYREAELEYFLTDARPKAVVCSPATTGWLPPLARKHGVPHVFTLDGEGRGSLRDASAATAAVVTTVNSSPDDIAAILYTSGTTGRPKGAMITHGNLAANGIALQASWGFNSDDVLLHALPIYHVHGLFVACHCALLSGARMLFLPRFDVKTVIRLLPRTTVFMGVPTYYTRLLGDPSFGRDACRNMRLFVSGSAPLLIQTFDEFRGRTGHTILERYGMTETGMNTSNPLVGPRIAGTVGKPLPGISVRIVDENGREVRSGEVGRLLVKGGNVFKGYWGMSEKTAEEFTADGYFRTGDLASIDECGYVSIVGRGKDLIITGGLNVYPKEIESYIDRVDGVVESAVIGVPHPDFGEAVVAVVVRAPGREDIAADAIINHLKGTIASFKTPKRVFFASELPRNAMGKVQKNILREEYAPKVSWR